MTNVAWRIIESQRWGQKSSNYDDDDDDVT